MPQSGAWKTGFVPGAEHEGGEEGALHRVEVPAVDREVTEYSELLHVGAGTVPSTNRSGTYTKPIPLTAAGYTDAGERGRMNTTQNTQRIIATLVIAAAGALVLGSCARSPIPAPLEPVSNAQIAEFRSGYLELAERRAEMFHGLAQARSLNDLRHEVTRAQNRVAALGLSIERADVDPSGAVDTPRTLRLPLVQLERLHESGN